MPEFLYFDHAATTPLDRRVAEAMRPWLGPLYGNPSSLHGFGRQARAAVDAARAQTAALLNAEPGELLFTASGTEADNLALLGVFGTHEPRGHLVVSAFEHAAVLETARALAARGVAVTEVPVGPDGLVDPDDVARALRPDTRLVSIMAANNVVGTLQPLAEIGARVRAHGALFHTDAVQAAGKIPLDVRRLEVDLLSLSAHKFHGPAGVGALFVRQGVSLAPLLFGGGQEKGLRPATENVAGLVGLGRAAELARRGMADDAARLVALRERLRDGLADRVPNVLFVGDPWRRLPGHLALLLDGQEGEAVKLLFDLDEAGVAASTGSACSAGHAGQPSYVLLAMGYDPIRARGLLRLSLGRFTTEAHVDRFLELFPGCARSLRPTVSHLAPSLARNLS